MSNYVIIRSKRKTLAIHIRDGHVEVRAPLKMSQSYIDRFVASKENWITSKLSQAGTRRKERDKFILDYGGFIRARGLEYKIVSRSGTMAGFDGEELYLPPNLKPESIKSICTQIYRLLAKPYFTDRVAVYAEKMNVAPETVKVTGAKKRWGSCSGSKNICFAWRLIMAEDDVIDYVVVHELAHLYEMNHSSLFWGIVEEVLPDYKERRERLRALQKKLESENWD